MFTCLFPRTRTRQDAHRPQAWPHYGAICTSSGGSPEPCIVCIFAAVAALWPSTGHTSMPSGFTVPQRERKRERESRREPARREPARAYHSGDHGVDHAACRTGLRACTQALELFLFFSRTRKQRLKLNQSSRARKREKRVADHVSAFERRRMSLLRRPTKFATRPHGLLAATNAEATEATKATKATRD